MALIVTFLSLPHFRKAEAPIAFTLVPIVTVVSFLYPLRAFASIETTVNVYPLYCIRSGIFTFVSFLLLHPTKAASPFFPNIFVILNRFLPEVKIYPFFTKSVGEICSFASASNDAILCSAAINRFRHVVGKSAFNCSDKES